ncbi:MAG TPA: ammonia-forming cytochrome c nitrite reductase subunit c552 [Verrucomicrobiales bacterium]|nr:ammonia-forming cytochrome c nitrite reductase subunit c552 [Verrucomicrobiales bacterium]
MAFILMSPESMNEEWLFFTACLLLGFHPLVTHPRQLRTSGWTLLLSTALLALGSYYLWNLITKTPFEARKAMLKEIPREGRSEGYVTSSECRSCHPDQYHSWHQSYHRTMTQFASRQTVLGDFENVELNHRGEQFHLTNEKDQFWIDMPDADWKSNVSKQRSDRDWTKLKKTPRSKKRIGLVTGSHRLQKYWVTGENGNMQFDFPFTWLIFENRWVPREDSILRDPDLPPLIQVWNVNCIKCHVTGPLPGRNPESHHIDSRMGEVGISCEACHGTGEEHIRKHRNPFSRYLSHLENDQVDASIYNPSHADNRTASQVCAQCHGMKISHDTRWEMEGFDYRPGDDLETLMAFVLPSDPDRVPGLKDELEKDPDFMHNWFWKDGMIRISGREFNGMIMSQCYKKGEISCLSCHSMHEYEDRDDQLKPTMRNNDACFQCHQDYRDSLDTHTHHLPNSSGSLCYNCHMPHTSYALLSAIRSHQITSPNLESSVLKGVPNACNLCHLDKTLAWTQGQMAERYGAHKVRLSREQQSISAALLWLLKGHAAQRVITAWHFGWKPALEASGNQWQAPFLAQLLNDSYGVVRYMAWKSLKNNPGFSDFQYDFLDPSDKLKIKIELALKHWEKDQNISIHAGPEVLMDPDGTIMKQQMKHLLDTQDQRPVSITE